MHNLLLNNCSAWINFCALKKHAEGILRWKLNCARRYHDLKLVKIIIKEWRIWVVFRKEQNKRTYRLRQSYVSQRKPDISRNFLNFLVLCRIQSHTLQLKKNVYLKREK